MKTLRGDTLLSFSFGFIGFQSVPGSGTMEISSAAFKDRERIPIQYVMPGAGGKNISIPLTWKNVPSGTKSFALH